MVSHILPKSKFDRGGDVRLKEIVLYSWESNAIKSCAGYSLPVCLFYQEVVLLINNLMRCGIRFYKI